MPVTTIPVEVRLSVPLSCECAACGADLACGAEWCDGDVVIRVERCRVCLQEAARTAIERYLSTVDQKPWGEPD